MHIIFVMNPRDKRFAERIRMFPSLTKSCNINWINEWPEEAKKQIAQEKINEVECEAVFEGKISEIVEALKKIHENVEENSVLFKEQTGIDSFVSSSSYLELISTYKQLVSEKNNELNEN